MRWAGQVARTGIKRNAYRIVAEEPEGKRPLGSPRCRRMDDIKMYVRNIGRCGMDWIDLARVEITSTLKMEIMFSTESSLLIYQTTQSDNVEDQHLNAHRGDNTLKMNVVFSTETFVLAYSPRRPEYDN
jgi:hypothetical protein